MQIEINSQREAYFQSRGKIVLNACPGSGKTTCIIYKLSILEEECLRIYGQYAGILCLSFTNNAKNEVLHKYKLVNGTDLKYPHLVSTIDSFINKYVTLPFFNLVYKNAPRPRIVDDEETIEILIKTTFKNEKGEDIPTIHSPMNRFKTLDNKPMYRSYPPSEIWVDANGHFSFKGVTPSPDKVNLDKFQEYGQSILTWKIKTGVITSLDAAYIALCLLKKFKNIAYYLIARFPYLIIDEAQDNSEIQHAIFDVLIDCGLKNIEMVGDPYQSLYEWRNARPRLFLEKFELESWNGLPLSENRRSVQRIIDCFSILRSADDEKITTVNVVDMGVPVTIYKYTERNAALIVQHFEKKCIDLNLGINQIVVRGKALKNKMLGNRSEIAPWKGPVPETILCIKHSYDCNAIKEAVKELRKLVLRLSNPTLDYKQMKEMEDEVETDYRVNGKIYFFLSLIPPTTLSFKSWTDQCIDLFSKHFQIDAAPLFEFKKRIDGYKMVVLKEEPISSYFNKPASTEYNIPVTTIHQVKGSTLDAILYFFDENSTGQSVSFKDFERTNPFPTEKQRIIYVACSRPQQFLAMAFPAKIKDKDLIARFGNAIDIICP